MIISGNGGYGLLAAYIGGPAAQADWLGLKVGGHLAPCCIHRVNRVNSRNGSAMMTALWILSWLLLWLLLLDIRIHGDLCVEPYDSSFHLWIILYKSWLDLWVEKIKSEQLFQKAITAELRGQSLKLYKKSSRLELRKHFSAKELLITVISHRMT